MIANALLLTIAVLLAYGFWLMDQLKFMAPYKTVIFHAYGNVLLGCGGCPVPERIRRFSGHQPEVLPERYGPQTLPPRQAIQRRTDRDARAVRRRGAELRCPATSIPTIRKTRATRPLARPHRHREPEPSETRTGRGSGDAPHPDRQEPEARERSVLKPEREDSPRAYYVRDREYLLRESEIHTLSELGRFRVVAPRDLAKYGYAGDSARMERDIRRLKEQSLLTEKTLEISGKKTLRVLTLTKQGAKLLRKTNRLPDEQEIYHGLVKPREAKHDADLYRLYQKEASRIERAGGKPLRVILDYELKRDLYRDLVALGPQKDDPDAKELIAEKHHLHAVNGKIPLPDLRIEYENAQRRTRAAWTWSWQRATTAREDWRQKPGRDSPSTATPKTHRVCAAF